MKQSTALINDVARYLTAEEKAQLLAILDNVADRSAEHAEESKSNVDARVRRERTTRISNAAALLANL